MNKEKIQRKKRKVFELKKAKTQNGNEFNEERYIIIILKGYNLLDTVCVDCCQQGHYTKKYFKCKLYIPETADQGTINILERLSH
jgi:hypothetical protein